MILFFIFLFGLIIGSFLNAVIYRLEVGGSLVTERSRCPLCGGTLSWYELIPLLSFLFQKGRCLSCGEKISWQYPIVELLTGFLFLLTAFLKEGSLLDMTPVDIIYIFIVMTFLVLIFIFDGKHYIIPNVAIYPLIAMSFFYNIYSLGITGLYYFLGAFIASGFFLLLYLISSGKWIGMGDVKYGAFMGFFLPWTNVLVALFIAYVIGAIFGLALLYLRKKGLKSEIPFGPFLIIGTLIAYFFGTDILSWYLGGVFSF
ncbi:MAG: prepilin peptidase [Patescibacteria group bacterium]